MTPSIDRQDLAMHFLVNTTDRWQRPLTVRLTLLPETVEVRCGSTLRITDRRSLAEWIRSRQGQYRHDDLDWLASGDSVALAVDDVVPAWFLDDHVVTALRVQL